MPFDIKFGHHFKRYNSTSQPDTSGWYSTEAVWKNSQDIDNPTWHIQESTVSDLLDWNYAYLPEHNAYYWITSIVSVGNNRWQISATMDVLATYKQAIMDTPGMIEYGFNVDASGAQYRLPDQRQNVSQVPTVATAKADITGGAINKEFGSYVLTAVGKQGGVTAYALSLYDIRGLLNSVGKDIGDAISELTSMEEIFKYFTANGIYQGNAISAIRNCTWMPLRLNIFEGDIQPVYLGDFDTTRTGTRLNDNPVYVHETDIPIPWPVSDWRRMNCQILLYVPFIGTVGVPIDQCNNATSLHVTFSVELITGGISVRIDAGQYCVYTGSGNIGVPYAIGSSNVPIQNTISGVTQAIGGAMQFGLGLPSLMGAAGMTAVPVAGLFAGNVAAGAVNQMSAGISNMGAGINQAITPVVQCAGSLGGSAAIGQSMDTLLTLLYYPPIDDAGFSALYGHPVMRVTKPVAGYCKTRGFSLVSGARASEMQLISNLMDGGVFIE